VGGAWGRIPGVGTAPVALDCPHRFISKSRYLHIILYIAYTEWIPMGCRGGRILGVGAVPVALGFLRARQSLPAAHR